MNFWSELKKDLGDKPILCLAPMADVTDSAFRFIISKYSKDKSVPRSLGEVGFVTWTEFVSADGLVLAPEKGRKKLMRGLEYSEIERPIVAQFFTSKPEMMEKVARLALELGFDGVDINMGCPDKSVEKQGAGASLIKNPELAKEIILSAKRGAKSEEEGGIPVSVKTRLGYNKDELETWLPELLSVSPAVITLHARTRKEMSKVPARWERVKRAVEIRDEMQGLQKEKTLIFGNGDIVDVEDAILKCKESGADGAMLGRAIFGNPFLFSKSKPSYRDVLSALGSHIKLFNEKFGDPLTGKNFAVMKKHFKSYLSSARFASGGVLGDEMNKLKEDLMLSENAVEAEQMVNNFLIHYNN